MSKSDFDQNKQSTLPFFQSPNESECDSESEINNRKQSLQKPARKHICFHCANIY